MKARAWITALLLAAACHSSKPAAQPVENTPAAAEPVASSAPAPAAAGGDVCAKQQGCAACIAANCQFDVENNACTSDCTSINCLVVGAKNVGEDRAAAACSGVTFGKRD